MRTQTSRPNRFKQLRWKLMLSYTGVTVGALIVLEIVLIAGGYFWWSAQLQSGQLLTQMVEVAAGEFENALLPYLSQTPPDQIGLTNWLKYMIKSYGYIERLRGLMSKIAGASVKFQIKFPAKFEFSKNCRPKFEFSKKAENLSAKTYNFQSKILLFWSKILM